MYFKVSMHLGSFVRPVPVTERGTRLHQPSQHDNRLRSLFPNHLNKLQVEKRREEQIDLCVCQSVFVLMEKKSSIKYSVTPSDSHARTQLGKEDGKWEAILATENSRQCWRTTTNKENLFPRYLLHTSQGVTFESISQNPIPKAIVSMLVIKKRWARNELHGLLYWDFTENSLRIRWDFTETSLRIHWEFTGNAGIFPWIFWIGNHSLLLSFHEKLLLCIFSVFFIRIYRPTDYLEWTRSSICSPSLAFQSLKRTLCLKRITSCSWFSATVSFTYLDGLIWSLLELVCSVILW